MPGPLRLRRWRITTTPTEIAARTAIAIRIGTSGEEPPLSCWAAGLPDGFAPGFAFWPEAFSGLPCAVPPLSFLAAPPAVALDSPSFEEPALPDEPEFAEPPAVDLPPLVPELCAVELPPPGEEPLPCVGVGVASSYWMPLESA